MKKHRRLNHLPHASSISDSVGRVDFAEECDAVSLTPGCEGGVEYWGLASGVSNKTHLGGNLVSAQFNAGNVSHFQAGQVYLLRHYTYRSSVFYTGDNSKNISYKNIRIYAAYGSGFVAGGGASHMLFSGITIPMKGNLRGNEDQLTERNPDKTQIIVKNNVLK